jgi:hypothetical protein
LTLFDVLLSMFVLPAAQVLLQSSGGRAPRAAAKPSAASNAGCVVGALLAPGLDAPTFSGVSQRIILRLLVRASVKVRGA